MLNIIALQGRLAADPEMRQTTTGKSVCTFRIACDRGRKDANGNSQTDWIPCTAWEKTAEFICKYFGKGALIAVDGRLQSRQYQDKNGQNRTAIEVVVQNAHFCGKSDSAAHPAACTQGKPNVGYSNGNDADFAEIEDNGDLPF